MGNKYGTERPPDAHAIADLALYNYIEMRDLVTSNWFLFRKKVDNILTTILPSLVVPLYEMTVFRPDIRYSEAITRNKKQGKVIDICLFVTPLVLTSLYFKQKDTINELV